MPERRKPKECAKIKNAIIQSLKNGDTLIHASELAKVNRQTVYNWMATDKKFYKAVEEAKLSRVQVAEDALYKLIANGNVTAIIFFLCNRAPEKWKNVNKVDIEGKLQLPKPVVIEPVSISKENKNEKQS